jgi:acyl carrier protein
MTEVEVRTNLRTWIRNRAKLAATRELNDDTPILDQGILSSLDVAELILYIESLKGEEVDIASIEPKVLKNIDTLYIAFFGAGPGAVS